MRIPRTGKTNCRQGLSASAALAFAVCGMAMTPALADPPYRQVSGVYPHLAYFNPHGECGTGAVVPWAGKLWVITYGPHYPDGSKDKLYEIDEALNLRVFEGSVGGTPANRMIHRETGQLLIGPYVIDAKGGVRVIPPSKMRGRLTGVARHLFEPQRKAYYATMEEGFYEVDLETLEVIELFRDTNRPPRGAAVSSAPQANLPGYHGKGLYSGQGRLVYANNGERSKEARIRPDIPSGCLAEWEGKSSEWRVVRRNQFTDVTGPGGIHGATNPATDPLWSIGWDHRSLLLMLLDRGEWSAFRLPKTSHCYDGAHGWNTEWPRIRDIGEDDLLMTMHGTFWRFPRGFRRGQTAGIRPRSSHLRVIGDFCRWGDRLVLGCDDTAKSEFLNTRRAKGKLAGPGQSHSNLWFVDPAKLDTLGPRLGRGAVWRSDDVAAGAASDPFLVAGYSRRVVCLTHESQEPVTFRLEADRDGSGKWKPLSTETVPPGGAVWREISGDDPAVWVRVLTDTACQRATARFLMAGDDPRPTEADTIFDGLATGETNHASAGLLRVRGDNLRTLAFAARVADEGAVSDAAFYELDASLNLKHVDSRESLRWLEENAAIPTKVLEYDAASIVYTDDQGQRWRLPRRSATQQPAGPFGERRVCREVATERDLFSAGGLFYELPARNAGGFAKVRPVCSHGFDVHDYCSYRGLMVLSGVAADAPADNPHILRSEDGRVALWAGAIDDLWRLGKPTGIGGPWLNTKVQAGQPSEPYLVAGFDRKTITLSHNLAAPVRFTLQADIDGTGKWVDYRAFQVEPKRTVTQTLDESFAAYWIRVVANETCKASCRMRYD